MHILVPKVMPDLWAWRRMLFLFFVGPIRGAGDWHRKGCILTKQILEGEQFVAAIPCRWDDTHSLSPHFIPAPQMKRRQTIWERRLLKEAGEEKRQGCIIAYFEKQREPRPPEAGVYARDTLGEVGEWRGRMMSNPNLRMVVGADPEYDPDGISVMKANFDDALGYDFPIYTSLQATIEAGIKKAREVVV